MNYSHCQPGVGDSSSSSPSLFMGLCVTGASAYGGYYYGQQNMRDYFLRMVQQFDKLPAGERRAKDFMAQFPTEKPLCDLLVKIAAAAAAVPSIPAPPPNTPTTTSVPTTVKTVAALEPVSLPNYLQWLFTQAQAVPFKPNPEHFDLRPLFSTAFLTSFRHHLQSAQAAAVQAAQAAAQAPAKLAENLRTELAALQAKYDDAMLQLGATQADLAAAQEELRSTLALLESKEQEIRSLQQQQQQQQQQPPPPPPPPAPLRKMPQGNYINWLLTPPPDNKHMPFEPTQSKPNTNELLEASFLRAFRTALNSKVRPPETPLTTTSYIAWLKSSEDKEFPATQTPGYHTTKFRQNLLDELGPWLRQQGGLNSLLDKCKKFEKDKGIQLLSASSTAPEQVSRHDLVVAYMKCLFREPPDSLEPCVNNETSFLSLDFADFLARLCGIVDDVAANNLYSL